MNKLLYLNGIIAINIAFSCTCQPNKNEVNAHKTIHLRKFIGCLSKLNNLYMAGNINITVSSSVTIGVTFGKNEWENS